MFKKLSMFLAAVLLVGCTALGGVTPQTLNERVAVVVVTTTGVREQTAVLLASGKISKADAIQIQKQADVVIEGAQIARNLPGAAGETKLASTIAVLKALQTYLLAKEVK